MSRKTAGHHPNWGGKREGASRPRSLIRRSMINVRVHSDAMKLLDVIVNAWSNDRLEKVYVYSVLEELVAAALPSDFPDKIERSGGDLTPLPSAVSADCKKHLKVLSEQTGHSKPALIDHLLQREARRYG